MLIIAKCLKCGSAAELCKGNQEALCLGGCPKILVNEDNFEIYSIEGNIVEWVQWIRNGDSKGEA